jgi:putative tricarboxylic transport membrane protein
MDTMLSLMHGFGVAFEPAKLMFCLIGCIALNGGFVIAIALLFACTSRGMGRQAFAVDLAIGFILGLAIYLTFAKLLTLILPSGPLERLFL